MREVRLDYFSRGPKPPSMKERSAFALPGDLDPDSFRDEKRVVLVTT